MKKFLYIFATGFLGLLLATVLHGVIEMIALAIIFGNPDAFAQTFWWQNWAMIHDIGSTILWIAGLVTGLYLGQRWWEPHGRLSGFYHWKQVLSR